MDGRAADLAAFILAGGKSSRMGTDKAFVALEGRTLLSRALELACSVSSNVRIVGSTEKFDVFGTVVEDQFSGCGPLAGIHAGLRASAAELNLIIAVDLPFISADFLRFLIDRARRTEALVTLPRTQARLQPLCAVYRRSFADIAEPALLSGQYKIDALFDPRKTHVIPEEDLVSAGFSAKMFRNLNTPEELQAAMTEQKSMI
jgi:molybdopterin-guanine dinucleotide biosynthesis protein A